MIHVTLNCSSPFVGYTIKTADCENRVMTADSAKYLTARGNRFFSVSGSQYLLGKFSGKEYFHALDLGVASFDEHNRRIYTSLAFVGDNDEDANAVDRIAVYAILQKERFYVEFSKFIILKKSGYSVRFDDLSAYLNRFYEDIAVDDSSARVKKIVAAALAKGENETIKLIVYENGCDWNYFALQVRQDDLKRAKFELKQSDINGINAEVKFAEKNSSGGAKKEPEVKKEPAKQEPEAKKESTKEEKPEKSSDQIKLEEQAKKAMEEIAELKKRVEKMADERTNLQYENSALKNRAEKTP